MFSTNVRCVRGAVSSSEGGAIATRRPSGCSAYMRALNIHGVRERCRPRGRAASTRNERLSSE